MSSPLLRTSRWLTMLPIAPSVVFVGHAIFGNRRVLDRASADFLGLFEEPRSSKDAAAEALRRGMVPGWVQDEVGTEEDAVVPRLDVLVRELKSLFFLVSADEDEEQSAVARILGKYGRNYLNAFGLDAMEDTFEAPLSIAFEDRISKSAGDLEPAVFLVLGWCLAQSLRPALAEGARRRGLDATVHVGFPDNLHLVEETRPDAVVLQLSHRLLQAPLLEGFDAASPEEAAERVAAACASVRHAVNSASRVVPANCLLLVQGIAAPQTSPFGVLDFRRTTGIFEAVRTVDRAAREAAAALPNALFVDEERLLASHGKRSLLDDLVSTYSHHGMAGSPRRMQLLFANGYLVFEVWRGRRQIRCVAVDLDGTLWPGEIADDEFSFDAGDMPVPMMYERFGGLHEALQILRRRGILLAVVSKNERDDVLAKWHMERVPLALGVKRQEMAHLLTPQDFVVLKIGWESKSEQLRTLANELGVGLGQIAFIDDNPVERAEVSAMLPGVWVLGDDMDGVRGELLSSPRLQPLDQTDEARLRLDSTRGRLAREAAEQQAVDRSTFLEGLAVRCLVRREHDASRAARISELLKRTNQFNTTGLRLSSAQVADLIAQDDASVLTIEVTDRFAEHGLTGVALLQSDDPGVSVLACFAMSCRVIGLDVEQVLLRRVLELARERGGVLRVPFQRTERNLPATRLFLVPGFVPLADRSGYEFDVTRSELPDDPRHCAVRVAGLEASRVEPVEST